MSIFSWLFGPARKAPIPRPLPVPPSRRLPPLPDGRFRFIALDVETANRDIASICQIGIACVDSSNSIATWSTLIDPLDEFDAGNVAIHGITDRDVSGSPTFDVVLSFLSKTLTRNTVFQHSNFDRQAIEAACQRHELKTPVITWADSVMVARRVWPELRGNGGHGLANLKKHLQLNFKHHDAEQDARACAQVVLLAENAAEKPFPDLLAKPSRKKFQQPASAEINLDGPLAGEVAVFTGALSLKREEAAKLAARQGLAVAANVTEKTTLLIVGDQDLGALAGHEKSSKHRKAESLIASGQTIRIIGESEFLKSVGQKQPPRVTPRFDIRKQLGNDQRWTAAKAMILTDANATPQALFAEVKIVSEIWSEVVSKHDLSYRDAVILSQEIEEMVDFLSDLADEADLRDDPQLKLFEIVRDTMAAIEDTASELVIVKSGIRDRLASP